MHRGQGVWKRLDLLVVGALLYTIAFPPYSVPGAAWIALTPLFLLLYTSSAKHAFLVGFLFGVLWCVGVGYWVYFTVTESFSIPFPANLLFILANYAFFAGLPTGVVTLFSSLLLQRGTTWPRTFGIPALWVSGEFLRANSMFGVSWGILGYTQYQHPTLIQIADVTSVYGISFLLALGSYAAAEIIQSVRGQGTGDRKVKNQRSTVKSSDPRPLIDSGLLLHRPWPTLGLFAVGLAVTLSYGTFRVRQYTLPPDVPPLRVAVAQGHIPTEQRWQPAYYATTLLKYAAITAQGIAGPPPDLVVWPEFAVNFYLDKEQLLASQLGQFARMANTALLVGAPRVEETNGATHYYNSAYLFSASGQLAGVYDKMRLVPFAEYRPFVLPGVVAHSPEAPSEFTAGEQATIFALPKTTLGITICYEAAFPRFSRALAQRGAQVFVNISNDTWLGGVAAAVEQHFAMGVLRAVENKRYLVRAATAGLSSFVDPLGHVYHLSTAPEGVMRGEVFPLHDTTVYTSYGDWFAVTCLLLSTAGLFMTRSTPAATGARP
jgi:apolipoprotein N-acyltransferase